MLTPDMDTRVTIYDVAAIAQVSPSTVSRVINSAANVSEGTRERVQAVMHELDFHPNKAARRLAHGRFQRSDPDPVAGEAAGVISRASTLLYFAGAWSSADREIIEAAAEQRQPGTPWLCVKARLNDGPLFVALQLREPEWAVIAGTPMELVKRMRRYPA